MSPMDRRAFLSQAGLGVLAMHAFGKTQHAGNAASTRHGVQHCVTEWAYSSGKAYPDPFNDVDLDVVFQDPQGREQRVPAFWSGEQACLPEPRRRQVWSVRYAPSVPGRYTYRTVASDPSNTDLHEQRGVLEVTPYAGDNPLLRHGPLRIVSDRRHFEHEDGTPFFWLGDTWWMGLSKRLGWPDDFQTLAADRVGKGFTIVQIVAGLYPDMPPFDPRGENEAGCPWQADFARINPHYFDMADLRIQCLADRGLVPCLVGCWGYFLPIMGLTKIKQHWRYLIARWGAYPVVWCLAGEGTMPYYLSESKAQDAALQKRGWTEVARYVRDIDPYRHPITIHPSTSALDAVEDPAVLDFDMLQTGHGDRASIPGTINQVTGDLLREPRMPVLVGEVCYEGILDENREDVVRFMFWACILSGAAGHTYGANGIWQVNTPEKPFGPSPHGRSYGDTPWQVAYRLPGSRELGYAKKMLTRYPWWRFEPHPEWVDPHWTKGKYMLPYAAGIPGEVRVVFIPPMWDSPRVKNLESGITCKAFFFNPRTGEEHEIGEAAPDTSGSWQAPLLPTFEQWVLVLERKR